MTDTVPLCSVYLVGDPDEVLAVRVAGRITLDTARAPHVEADIDIPLPSAAMLAALDPRATVRIRIVVEEGDTLREFNLGLRDRDTRHGDGIVTLFLASDEALLEDYKPLADDTAPRALETSLRDVVDYVLDTVIPGAALEATPAHDADVTAYWPLVNMAVNPSGWPGTQGYAAGANTSTVDTRTGGYIGTTSVRWYSTAAGGAFLRAASVAVEQGRSYYVHARVTNSLGRDLRMQLRFLDPDGGEISRYETAAITATGGWDLLDDIVTAPPGAASMAPFLIFGASAGGEASAVDALMVVESTEPVAYFQGGGMTLTGYTLTYDAGGSGDGYAQSIRTPLIERDPESTIWRAGQSGLDFLAPLIQAAGYRLVCDEQRRWTLRDEHHTEDGTITIRHGVNLGDAQDRIGRDTDIWFDAAVAEYTWTDRDGIEQRRLDSYALTGTPTRTRKFDRTDTAYPGPGFAEYAVRRAQQRGREITATKVADADAWAATCEQSITIKLDRTPTQIGNIQSIEFNLERNEITATARTIEIPDGAIDLLDGIVNDLPGIVNDL